MKCLEENHIGYDTGFALVPLVVQSGIYDLSYGNANIRPDSTMGYEACRNALATSQPMSGSVGAGTGATVGKLCGMMQSQKSGIGYHAVQIGKLKLGAVVVVNALGDIYANGKKIAGLMNKSGQDFLTVYGNCIVHRVPKIYCPARIRPLEPSSRTGNLTRQNLLA